MKVCVVNPNFYKSSGVTKVIRSIYEEMQANIKYQVDWFIVDCRYGSEVNTVDWASDVSVFKLMSLSPFIFFNEILRFRRWLACNNVDIVHIHHRRLALIFSIFKPFFKANFLYTGHSTYNKNFFFKKLMRMPCVSISDSVHLNILNTTSSIIVRQLGNPVSFPKITPNFLDSTFDTAITIGRLTQVKGINYIIDAFALLHLQGFKKRLIIVGEGDMKECLIKQVRDLNLQNFIEFVGFTEDVDEYIDRACFSILHSKLEGFGLVTVESAARGKATLVTDVDGSRDLIPNDHKLPNLVEFGNVTQLADALHYWFNSGQELKIEGIMFNNYLSKYSTDNVASAYYEFYRWLIYGRS